MAIGVVIHYISDEHKFPGRILLVDALGVSGGDQCHELTKGQEIELWLSAADEARITLKDHGPEEKG